MAACDCIPVNQQAPVPEPAKWPMESPLCGRPGLEQAGPAD